MIRYIRSNNCLKSAVITIKNKHNFRIKVVVLTIFAFCGSLNVCMGQRTQTNDEIKTMIFNFYKEYLSSISQTAVNPVQKNKTINKYCTPDLIERINSAEPDYDPFINAQDFDDGLINRLKIDKDSMQNDVFDISYFDRYSNTTVSIKLKVSKKGSDCKIDSILTQVIGNPKKK